MAKKPNKNPKIAEVDCPGCGNRLDIRINSAGCAYYFCVAVVGEDPETGKPEKCMCRHNWGRTATKKMIEAAKAAGQYEEGASEDVQQSDIQHEGQPERGDPEPEQGTGADETKSPVVAGKPTSILGNILSGGTLFDG